MKILLVSLVVLSSMMTMVKAQILDPFTTTDTGSYVYFNAYNPNGDPASITDFGTAASGTWSPAPPDANSVLTDYFVLGNGNNSAQLVNVGDSVSLNINLPTGVGGGLGIVLSGSNTDVNGDNSTGIIVIRDSLRYYFAGDVGGNNNDASNQTGYSTMTITKTGADDFTATLTGGGINPLSEGFTFTAANDYIGLAYYTNGNGAGLGGATAQDFVLNAASVPEPGTNVLLGLGLLSLAGFAYRRNRQLA